MLSLIGEMSIPDFKGLIQSFRRTVLCSLQSILRSISTVPLWNMLCIHKVALMRVLSLPLSSRFRDVSKRELVQRGVSSQAMLCVRAIACISVATKLILDHCCQELLQRRLSTIVIVYVLSFVILLSVRQLHIMEIYKASSHKEFLYANIL